MKRSIITRLYIGFAVAIILVLGVGISSYQTIQHQAYSGQWVKHTYEVMNTVKDIQATIPRMRSSLKNYYITGEDQFRQPFQAGKINIFKRLDELKALFVDNPSQLQKADTLVTNVQRLVFFWDAFKLSDSLSHQEKLSFMTEEQNKIDGINTTIERLYSAEQNLLYIREQADADSNTTATEVLIGGITLILIIVFTLIYFILREFNQRTQAEESLKKSIQDVTALNDVADKQNWLLTGVSKVNNSLQGNQNIKEITASVSGSIVKYLQATAAAFYLLDETQNRLELKASIGLVAGSQSSYMPDELPGGMPAPGEVKVISGVPAAFWQIESALGKAEAGEIALIAIYFGEELKGILELANFKGFTPGQLELLTVVSDNIGVALNTAQASEKIMTLLSQVQEQKEALEHQQEELRQSNEELTRQAEVLQASEEELKVQEEELRHINTELEEKNEAVEMARQALQVKAKELDDISRYKSEFLANMSHELRTPLNSILILANMLAENKKSNLTDKQVEYASIIHKSGNDLLNLINDILDLSKIEAGKIDIQIAETTVKAIVDDITPPFVILAENKKLHFNTVVDDNVPGHISTDKLRLEQVIKNLLSNAFKFTDKGGSITLRFSVTENNASGVQEQFLAMSVKDTGIGIAPEKQRLIFEAFQQADGSTSRKFGGTGLGLSISRELVRIFGGHITVVSEPGLGSTFTVFVPLKVPAGGAKPSAQPLKIALPAAVNIIQQPQLKDDRDNIAPGDKVMLIIEDDTKFAFILQSFARDRNYKTIVALSGDEGLICASKYIPAAIILDIQLPVLDGWSILKALKNNDKLKNIPVHIISVDDSSDGKAEGAIAYLKKPVSKESLEKAFTDIAGHIQSFFKKILFYCEEPGKSSDLQNLLTQRKMDVTITHVTTPEQTVEALKNETFDCLIADIGSDIAQGLQKLTAFKEAGVLDTIQVIICLDQDISREDEWKLKKFSGIVIRDSAQANQRLTDELELFLYKIQQVQKVPYSQPGAVTDDNVFAGKKILLVDDDMRNVFALSVALEEQKMVVCTANDGKEALEVLKNNKDIAIVLMDIMMPEMDGYEAMRHIRNTMQLTSLPVIALTAKAMQGDKEKSIEAGASDYITKPVDVGRLLSLMRVWLSQ
ncbi:MAG TPA: response regulator [Chitinophagaceae bacterium]|nr:response regulator [Chitinophagaceae bacterium]